MATWDRTAEYVGLTRRDIPQGGRTSYVQPHPLGASPTDVTSFVYGQAEVTINNWPDIMYMLEPPPEWQAFKCSEKPKQKLDKDGQTMLERYPRQGEPARPLLDFPVLPDTISTNEDWWFFDLWRRIDPRITWDDITMRMKLPNRTVASDKALRNRIQTMCGRTWRPRYQMLSWFGKGHSASDSTGTKGQVLRALAAANVPRHLNTTRGLTPGLVDPTQPNGPRIPHPNIPRRAGISRGAPSASHATKDDLEEDGDVEGDDNGGQDMNDGVDDGVADHSIDEIDDEKTLVQEDEQTLDDAEYEEDATVSKSTLRLQTRTAVPAPIPCRRSSKRAQRAPKKFSTNNLNAWCQKKHNRSLEELIGDEGRSVNLHQYLPGHSIEDDTPSTLAFDSNFTPINRPRRFTAGINPRYRY